MDYYSAEMTCILKVNIQCEGCKSKVMQILRNIRGVYNITVDGEQGTVQVTGRVNPNTLLRVLEKYGSHAEVKYVEFGGGVVERNPLYNSYGDSEYASPYGVECPYPPLGCPQHQTSLIFSPPSLPPPPPPPLASFWAPPPRPYGPPPYMVPFRTLHPPTHTRKSRQNRNLGSERNHCAVM